MSEYISRYNEIESVIASKDTQRFNTLRDDLTQSLLDCTITNKLARTNNIDSIRFIHENKFNISNQVILTAIKYNAIETVKYLLYVGLYNVHCTNAAVEHSLFMTKLVMSEYEVLYWMHELLHLSKDLEVAKYLVEERNISVTSDNIRCCIHNRRMDLLPYMIEKYDEFHELKKHILFYAIKDYKEEHGLEIIEYLLSIGADYDTRYAMMAADRCSLTLVTFFHQRGYKISKGTCSMRTEVNDYLHKHKLGIYRTCNIHCSRCLNNKIEDMTDTWYLESENYQCLNQWLPREMLEDVIELCKI